MAGLIKSIAGSPLLAAYGCVFAFLFGIVHTFLPGHGKTIVCGYCVGRKRDVAKIFFVTSVTVGTHLFSSAALGALAMTTSHVLVKSIILPRLQLVSATILLLFGVGLLLARRFGSLKHAVEHLHSHEHAHAHEDDHGHSHGSMDALLERYMEEPQVPFHHYVQLFWLGLAAGIIPCLEPFTLMLFAISLNRIALGFGLLLCFGLGVFGTMITLAMLVTSDELDPRRRSRNPLIAAAQKGATAFKTVYPVILMGLGACWIYVTLRR